MAKQHVRARRRPGPGEVWLGLLIYPWTPVPLCHNIWIIACNVPGRYPLSIKAFIYLGRTLNILVFNTVAFDLMELLFAVQDFFFHLPKSGVERERIYYRVHRQRRTQGPYPTYFTLNSSAKATIHLSPK